jgi:Ca2+-binding EF-hand superfamily protein
MKLKKSFIYGIGILCLTCFASAQDGERKGPPEGGRPPGGPPGGPQGGGDPAARLAEFIKRADADADGKISKDEFANMGKKESDERFGRMDANSDGFVDQDEIGKISQMMRRGAEGQGMRRPDGSPGGEGGFRRPPGSEGDRPKGPEGAGRPDGERPRGAPEGMRPGGEGGPRGGGMLGDPKESFKRMDADGNGSVSEEEYIAATEKMREMMRSRGGQPGQGGARRPEGGPPGGAPGGEGGFRRPPTEGDAPKPEGDKPKDPA